MQQQLELTGLSNSSQLTQQQLSKLLKVKDIEKYPNRLIGFLKCHLIKKHLKKTTKIGRIHGTGFLIDENLVITAAHNILPLKEQLQKLPQQQRNNFAIEGHFYLALHKNEHSKQCLKKYLVKDFKISQNYQQFIKQKQESNNSDYALLVVSEETQTIPEQKYLQLIIPNPSTLGQINEIQLFGYPVIMNKAINNKNKSQFNDKSSFFMTDQYGGITSSSLEQNGFYIQYSNYTEIGHSGSPIIFRKGEDDYWVIGVHKGKKVGQNFGVYCLTMLEEVNSWGYQLKGKPLVWTQKTYKFNSSTKKMQKLELLFLYNQKIEDNDLLAFISFKMPNLKKIILSGNKLTGKGVVYLSKKRFEGVNELLIADNNISADLVDLQQQICWKNFQNLTVLSLSINKIPELPQSIIHLKKLQNLYLCYNSLSQVPQVLSPLVDGKLKKLALYGNKSIEYQKKANQDLIENWKKKIKIYQVREQIEGELS